MPWHDVSVKVRGKVAYDVGIHFIELYNNVMTDIVGEKDRIKDLLQPYEGSPEPPMEMTAAYPAVFQAPDSPNSRPRIRLNDQIIEEE